MSEIEVFELVRETLFLILKITTPILLIVLCAGLVIAILQALTQIQESTLSFAPKIIAVIVGIIFLSPYIGVNMSTFVELIKNKIFTL